MAIHKDGKSIEKGGKKQKVVFVLCVAIILILLSLVIYLLVTRRQDEDVNRNIVVNEDNVDEVLRELDEKEAIPPGYYEVTMNSTWKFTSGDSPSENAYVKNAETNTNPVYFDIDRADTGERIYESPILPIGSHIENITLDSVLEEGTYDCILTYHLLDDENKSVSTLKMTITVVVEQ